MKFLRNDFFFEEVENFILQGEHVEILVRGRSMAPYLRDRKDKIVIAPFCPEELKKGDIVLFSHCGSYLLHRIIRRKKNVFITQGDSNIEKQEEVLLPDIIGIVRFKIKPNGQIVSVNRFSHRIYWHCRLFSHPIRRYLLYFYKLFVVK